MKMAMPLQKRPKRRAAVTTRKKADKAKVNQKRISIAEKRAWATMKAYRILRGVSDHQAKDRIMEWAVKNVRRAAGVRSQKLWF